MSVSVDDETVTTTICIFRVRNKEVTSNAEITYSARGCRTVNQTISTTDSRDDYILVFGVFPEYGLIALE